ncbi:DUF4175 family protein [Pedobacter sp.]
MGNNYNLLIDKINEFTRKFYLNKLLRGSIYAAALILSMYLCLFVYVFYSYPGVSTKTLLFYSFFTISLAAVIFWIVKPALSYFNLSKTISIETASNLIGNHFFNVKDRLLNTLQLKQLADSSPQNSALILAGIDQKIAELRPIPFSTAVNLGENKKYIKYIAFPLLVILIIGIISPAILKEGTSNFVRYNEEVLPKAPFQFVIENSNLNITQGDDLPIKLKLTGDEFPQDIYLEDGVNSYRLEKQDISHFSHTFKNIQKDKVIRFNGGGFNSTSHTIHVKPRPSLLNISANLIYPAYLKRKAEAIANVGDLLLPEGTKVNWLLKTENSDAITFILQQKTYQLKVTEDAAQFNAVIKQNGIYQIVPKNQFVSLRDSLNHQITVIKDQFPSINITETPDSISIKSLYFTGVINDDYGFSSLRFKYQIKENKKLVAQGAKSIPIKPQQTENKFFYLWNMEQIGAKPGQTIEYFFEVADNDGVNGAKVSRSEIKTYQAPTQREIAKKLDEGSQSLKKKMEETMKLANTIEKDSKKLSENLLNKKQLDFEDKKQIEQLLDKQKQLEDAVKDIKDQNKKNNFNKEENAVLNEELKEKQQKIDELFNNVLDEKTKELLQKLQQLMDQNNKEQTRNELQKMQMDNKSLKNELDRILELYKQLEFEQNLQNKIDRLNELSKQQKDLSQQSKDKNTSQQELKEKQDQLNKDFQDLKKELQELDKKNQSLERSNDYKNPEQETKEIEKTQQESKEQLNQNSRQKAAEKQQQAGQQMQQLAQQMQQQQQQGAEEETKVSAQELRKLLENLLSTSFEQEKVMLALRKMSASDPGYVAQAQKQNLIKENMKTIADSLFSLSKRVPQIESVVNTEVEKINFNIGKAIDFLGDRRTGEASRSQQFAMTSLNNLALMLNEALEQLQNAMKNAKSGKGKQKQSMQQLQQMQEQLNKNMQQAKEKMEREGNMGTVPKGQMSQEFAKMAQQQQMLREALEKVNKEDNKNGKGTLGNLNQAIQEMKQSELDLVNKRITQETINRQKNLMVKLLDAEKAQREQEQDEKRESNAAKQFPPSYQQMLDKFNKSMQSETELIKKLPPNLNYYYKNKVAEYFRLLNADKK